MSYVSILLAPHGSAGGDPPMAFPAINIFSSQRNTKGDRLLAVMKGKEGDRISCPSINRLPRIIASPPSTPLAIFSFFYPLPVKLKWNLFKSSKNVQFIWCDNFLI